MFLESSLQIAFLGILEFASIVSVEVFSVHLASLKGSTNIEFPRVQQLEISNLNILQEMLGIRTSSLV